MKECVTVLAALLVWNASLFAEQHCNAVGAKDVKIHQAQVEVQMPPQIQPVLASDGRRHLAYELHITNFNSEASPITLERISVFANRASQPLFQWKGHALGALLVHPQEINSDGIPIEQGRRKVLYLWLTLPEGATNKPLRQQLDFCGPAGELQQANITIPVSSRPVVEVGPPLRGGRWLATEGPGNARSHHWGSLVAVNGEVTIPQRFAIDWFGLDESNHSIRGQHASLGATLDPDWFGFNREVLAIADGVVRDIRNDAPDGTPLTPQEVPEDLTARSLYGNYVVLEIAPGIYAHYAHLRKGSLTVRPGQHIRRGAVIGRLGQTGSAGAPHLHFQVSDKTTFEESEGLPFTITTFKLLGKTKIETTFDPQVPVPLEPVPPGTHHGQMPLDGDVVQFP